jgi:hypothetical protein
MNKLFWLLLILLAMVYGFRFQGFQQGMSMSMGTGLGASATGHKLLIDGASGNYLLIDGANHYLKIDGA